MKVISVIIAKYCLWMGNYGYNLKCPQANIRKGDKMSKRIILGVNISARTQAVPNVQAVLTQFGCNIRTRLGLHEATDGSCAPGGLLILDTYGDEATVGKLASALEAIEGVEVRKMEFERQN